jgi:beta-glucosidase-like glycosyl hydrolase
MTMPGNIGFESHASYFGANLTAYVRNGTFRKAGSMIWVCHLHFPELNHFTDGYPIATRILASWYLLHQDSPSYPQVSFDSFQTDSDQYNAHIDVQDSHYKLVRELGAASIVLLKNKNSALPLGKHEGKAAERSLVLIGSDAGPGRMGPNEFSNQGGVITGTLAMGWGSGTANFTYLVNVGVVFFYAFKKP